MGRSVMKFSRRQFFRTASGALAFGSTTALLSRAGLAAAEPIKVANILDKTGGLNIYALKQIKADRHGDRRTQQSRRTGSDGRWS